MEEVIDSEFVFKKLKGFCKINEQFAGAFKVIFV